MPLLDRYLVLIFNNFHQSMIKYQRLFLEIVFRLLKSFPTAANIFAAGRACSQSPGIVPAALAVPKFRLCAVSVAHLSRRRWPRATLTQLIVRLQRARAATPTAAAPGEAQAAAAATVTEVTVTRHSRVSKPGDGRGRGRHRGDSSVRV